MRRYREMESFPGLELNQAGGNDFAKGSAELTLPPLRFRRAGVASFYANWARLALFTSALATGVTRRDDRQNLYDIGAQADLSLVIFSNLESMFSLGYAVAFDHGRHSNEVMVSLKLLK